MLYDLYLLVSILTSFLETISLSTRIINQNMYAPKWDEQALESYMKMQDLSSSISDSEFNMAQFSKFPNEDYERRHQFEMPDFTKFTRRVSEKNLGLTRTVASSILERASKAALAGSYQIWLGRENNSNREECMEYIYELLKRQENSNLGHSNVSIINGKVVKEAEYPHMGALGWWANTEPIKLVFLCGASLISDQFMLTAAHCTHSIRRNLLHREPYLVRLGTRYLELSPHEAPVDIRIKKFIRYSNYVAPHPYFDIALIMLEYKVSFSKFIQPACLSIADYRMSSKKKVIATGWGSVNAKSTNAPSRELRYAEVYLFNKEQCEFLLRRYHYRHWQGLQRHQICAGELDGNADTCKGDSGGPIQTSLISTTSQGTIHRILAITSFGLTKCATENAPGIYTKISFFIDWIENIVWPYEYEMYQNKK